MICKRITTNRNYFSYQFLSFFFCSNDFILDGDGDGDAEIYKAIFSQTTRGREQLIFCGQPFIYEKRVVLADGDVKKLWRCNQWWNKKCRARVYTIRDIVTPLNKFHTHADIIRRKKRIAKKKVLEPIESPPTTAGEEVSHFFIIKTSDKDTTVEDDDATFSAHLI